MERTEEAMDIADRLVALQVVPRPRTCAALYAGSHPLDCCSLVGLFARQQGADGSIEGSQTSITCSRMNSLTVEATSVAVLAWLNDDKYIAHARSAVEWITAQCQNGRFGSTQATVLALKAIIAYVRRCQ